ncbi:MAG: putative endonuclease [Patiriisocius sp.]|jgi:putative endonuclease
MKKNILNTKQIGDLGENVAAKHLENKGFTIVARNYWRKWGEIDIIAMKMGVLHCIEVKTVSYETKRELEYAVTHETWRPEEQVHARKFHQIEKALYTWLSENEHEGDYQIDVIAVRVVPRETYSTVNLIEQVTR